MKRNLITLVLCAFAFGLGVGFNNIAFSDIDTSKIAYVNVNKLITGSKTIKQAQSAREKQTTEMLKWYDSASDEIQKQETKEKRDALIKKYEAQLTQKKKTIKDAYSKEISQADSQMDTVIAQKAKELGYSVVFRSDSVLFGGTDITAQVLPLVK
ncbi:MAG: OmpH family outer membrane protein [Candidatus Gastranaerophilales bacterium]|nr:OmpH family outer membrane protein [Candidatus Gastranaerophilales bacterium]